MFLVFAAEAANPCCFDKALYAPERSRDPDFLAAMIASFVTTPSLYKFKFAMSSTDCGLSVYELTQQLAWQSCTEQLMQLR